MVNAVIYSRVSSVGSRQDTERQTKELTEYAARMGYNLVGIYEEKISGFKKNEDRPILSQMLIDIDRRKIDKVLTWELSRIGRNVIQGLSFVEELNSRKVSLFIKNYNLETLYEDKSINLLAHHQFSHIGIKGGRNSAFTTRCVKLPSVLGLNKL